MKPLSNSRQRTGNLGEQITATFLAGQGFRILERNFRVRYGELDIVAVDGATLVFVEVKTRSSRVFGIPEEAVTPRKVSLMEKAIHAYVATRPVLRGPMRIDVVAVELSPAGQPVIRHHRNVTG